MSGIDWSKAPEGAQAYMPANDQWFEGWWKMVGAQSYFWAAKGGDNSRWEASNARPWDFRLLVKRPAEPAWTGEGLPPVGANIECDVRAGTFEQCQVVAHVPHKGEMAAVFVFSDGNDWNWATAGDCFRPLLTSEQIAAEERQKSIEKMISSIHPGIRQVAIVNSAYGYLKEACADLYDAGYRKTEAP